MVEVDRRSPCPPPLLKQGHLEPICPGPCPAFEYLQGWRLHNLSVTLTVKKCFLTFIYIYVCVCVCVYMCVFIHTCVSLCSHMYICSYTCMNTYMYEHTYRYMNIRKHFFTMRVTEHWHRLPREIVESVCVCVHINILIYVHMYKT